MNNYSNNDWFVLFSSIVIVKGVKNNLLLDIQRAEYLKINSDIFNLFAALEKDTINTVLESYNQKSKKLVIQLINDFIKADYGHITKHKGLFTPISFDHKSPFLISNLILDIGFIKLSSYSNLFNEIKMLNIPFLQIRIYRILSIYEINSLLSNFNESRIAGIELYIQYSLELNLTQIQDLIESALRINKVVIFNSPFISSHIYRSFPIVFLESKLENEKCCGVISSNNFTLNIKAFTNALNHNSCLNEKIAIDSKGNIKNCPSMEVSFGNISDTSLMEALEKPDFKKFWNINKDKIHICKECEFRYICTDCRAYLENPEDIYSKPLKCGYNPYVGEWSDWSTSPLKEKSILYYKMEELVLVRQIRKREIVHE